MTLATRALAGAMAWAMWERRHGVQGAGRVSVESVVEGFNRTFRGLHGPLSEWLVAGAGMDRASTVAVAGVAVSALMSLVLTGLALTVVTAVVRGLRAAGAAAAPALAGGGKQRARRGRRAGSAREGPARAPDAPGSSSVQSALRAPGAAGQRRAPRRVVPQRPWWALVDRAQDAAAGSLAAAGRWATDWRRWARIAQRGRALGGGGHGRRGRGADAAVTFPLVSVGAGQGMAFAELRALLGGVPVGDVSVRVFARGEVRYAIREGADTASVPAFLGVVPGQAWGREVGLPFRLRASTALSAWDPDAGMLVTRVAVAPDDDGSDIADPEASRDASVSGPSGALGSAHLHPPSPRLVSGTAAVERRLVADVGLRDVLH